MLFSAYQGVTEFDQKAMAYVRSVLKELSINATALAEMAGVSQTTITRPLNQPDAGYRITEKTIRRIEEATGIPFGADGVADKGREYDAPKPNARPLFSATNPRSNELKPIYASAHGGNGDQILAPGEVVEWRAPPQRWDSVRGLYGFYVVGDSMEPRINPGEMVWIHPHRTPSPGQEGVFVKRTADPGETPIMVKELVKTTSANWVVRQHNPKKQFELRRDDWDCQLIVDIDLNR